MKTIEQLQSEAAAAAEALAAAQQAATEAAAAAQAAAAIEAERARREALRAAPEPSSFGERRNHIQLIASRMVVRADKAYAEHMKVGVSEPHQRITEDEEKGPTVYWQEPALQVSYRGASVYVNVEFKAEESPTSKYSYRRSYTGRLRMAVGGYGDRQSYPPRKDGSFNYDAAADKLLGQVSAASQAWVKANQVRDNAPLLTELCKEFSLSEFNSLLSIKKGHRDPYTKTYTEYAAPSGTVFLNLSKTVTPEQAQAILRAAIAAGVNLS